MRPFCFAFLMIMTPVAVLACPWAGNTYKMGGNISDRLFQFDAECSKVKISYVTSPSEFFSMPLKNTGRHWTGSPDNKVEFLFSRDGRTARIREGAQSARLAVSKQN